MKRSTVLAVVVFAGLAAGTAAVVTAKPKAPDFTKAPMMDEGDFYKWKASFADEDAQATRVNMMLQQSTAEDEKLIQDLCVKYNLNRASIGRGEGIDFKTRAITRLPPPSPPDMATKPADMAKPDAKQAPAKPATPPKK